MNPLFFVASLIIPCALASISDTTLTENEYGPPEPYTFGYKVHDKDGDQWRTEASDGHGKVEGSYGYVDNLGMRREVRYVADDNGFRADIKTNEPGMDMPNPADVVLVASPPSDYDATIYGIEAIPSPSSSDHRHLAHQARPIDLPQRSSGGFYKYHRFAEQSVPPIYVVDGHLQSPWFPMEV